MARQTSETTHCNLRISIFMPPLVAMIETKHPNPTRALTKLHDLPKRAKITKIGRLKLLLIAIGDISNRVLPTMGFKNELIMKLQSYLRSVAPRNDTERLTRCQISALIAHSFVTATKQNSTLRLAMKIKSLVI